MICTKIRTHFRLLTCIASAYPPHLGAAWRTHSIWMSHEPEKHYMTHTNKDTNSHWQNCELWSVLLARSTCINMLP
ncbi:uncharacterized protein B0H18DRAFT_975587, partial [Fomitopsis serialis]|uniref:uncharacterized protein n=1 Tax=Fomitopsis serialis TaxID=139415 RepID=UPI0020088FCB